MQVKTTINQHPQLEKLFKNFESAEQIRWKSNNDVDEEYFIERLKKFNFQHYVKKQEVENVK